MFKYLFIFVLIFLISGCSKNNIDYYNILYKKNNMVKSLDTLKVNNIEEKNLNISLGSDYQEIINEKDNRVFAAKFLLKKDKPFSLKVFASSNNGFFPPKFYFLDENNQIKKIVYAKDLAFDRTWYKGTVFINEDFKNIKYLVVTQDILDKHLTREINFVSASSTYVSVGTGGFMLNTFTGDEKHKMKNAFNGLINIAIE